MLNIDLSHLPTPCHLIDIDKVILNIEVIEKLKNKTDIILLFAIKGFSNEKIINYFINHFNGISASSLWEARLGKEFFHSNVHTFSPAYTSHNIQPICSYSDFLIFNSVSQFQSFKGIAKSMKCHCGLRINPEFSEIQKYEINPCHYASRLGIHESELEKINFYEVEGHHFQKKCEEYSEAFLKTINIIEENFGQYLYPIQWLNIGGGQFFSDATYILQDAINIINFLQNKYSLQIIAEPCETVMLNAGYFIATVTDIVENKITTAILDASAICHLPDIVHSPYRSEILNADLPNKKRFTYRIAGCTCYAGDIFGDYSFDSPLDIGTKIVFYDTASYTMVKSNIFNGIQLPYYATVKDNNIYKIEKAYNYDTFLSLI